VVDALPGELWYTVPETEGSLGVDPRPEGVRFRQELTIMWMSGSRENAVAKSSEKCGKMLGWVGWLSHREVGRNAGERLGV
jgi:hypothetical protein